MRISDWSSDVCSSDLDAGVVHKGLLPRGLFAALAEEWSHREPVTPLLEEKGDACEFGALISQLLRPLDLHDARLGAALPADDHPIQIWQVALDRQRPNQRLARQESDCGGDVAQVFDAPFGELVLDRDAEGDGAQA